MRLYSWNVNGIRSAIRKGLPDWIATEQPDALCLQETKAAPADLSESDLRPDGYESYWSGHMVYLEQKSHAKLQKDWSNFIDQTTGRVAHGRIWSRGLQQLIEVKEGCKPSTDQETIAQITYQRFFPRYLRLCGMSGTLSEARPETIRQRQQEAHYKRRRPKADSR